jgi:hypothetical protein
MPSPCRPEVALYPEAASGAKTKIVWATVTVPLTPTTAGVATITVEEVLVEDEVDEALADVEEVFVEVDEAFEEVVAAETRENSDKNANSMDKAPYRLLELCNILEQSSIETERQ